jgi:hypothetical protein
MAKKQTSRRRQRQQPERAIARIREKLARMSHVCSGSITKRMKTCGKAQCACHKDRASRHGPYYEWTRWEGKRLVHSVISAETAEMLRGAVSNYKKARRLLREWERASFEAILGQTRPKDE